ncbi:hypothetical protein [Pseudomonas putida]|uniref:hypothetical protein n=1 Tax=Pseudomonas putida TaxID=303 RepID=UPI0013A6EF91|nr:hypothetical protein [Pseudomonas putida]
MLNSLPIFFDHSRHKLWVRNLDAHLDVLAFKGEEHLSQPIDLARAGQGMTDDRFESFALRNAPAELQR